jgi:hypothetical protein
VEIAPQPWIYFESADAAPLHARYGDADAKAPLYDLEASRPGVEKRATATATWGETVKAAKFVRGEPQIDISVGGPIARDQFRVSRKIAEGPEGLAVLLLDAHVLARSNDLADVRIANPEGRLVPYLLEARTAPLTVKLNVASARRKGARRSIGSSCRTTRGRTARASCSRRTRACSIATSSCDACRTRIATAAPNLS